jgi:hypothetical protein
VPVALLCFVGWLVGVADGDVVGVWVAGVTRCDEAPFPPAAANAIALPVRKTVAVALPMPYAARRRCRR